MRSLEDDRVLAEQLAGNPLLHDLLAEAEKSAIEALIAAETEKDRIAWQYRVTAARDFRSDLARRLSNRKGKPAPV